MVAEPINSKGALYQISDGAEPPTWATVGSMMNVTPPDQQADEKDSTTHDSPGNYHKFTLTLINPGQAVIQTYSLPEDPIQDHISGLRFYQQHSSNIVQRIVWPQTPRQYFQSFAGRVKGSAMVSPIDGFLTTTWTVRVNGAVTDGYLA